ncbi:extracellular solute-binding protein [Streptomyces sp. JJ36]|uniref:extracellular solute-binding protein n=1 Tax=Streptomyces sp. JJ36 TaxID=2736645 RepID=UPI001F258C97|nr:extracellular solute-binding protein [Streptomyces sp. JJ36]MCF6525117.1 extracellular solute-binding protein [Streptomyces sp. JJ36]
MFHRTRERRRERRLGTGGARTVRRFGRPAAAAVVSTLLAACGAFPDQSDDTRTLDVWLMKGSLTDDLMESAVRDFEFRNPGVRVDVTVHEWPGIAGKVTEALRTGDGPDLIEVGNTQVAQYVDAGGVKNLTLKVVDLGGDDWIPGLAESGQVDGYQYGVPFYAANRVVIYRKDLFARAGITSPPETREEWLAATETLNSPSNQQGIYLPGQNWYVLAGFVWDEGGRLAEERSGRWSGALDTPEALRGMEFYRKLQALGRGPADSDEADPDQQKVFARERIAQLIAVPGAAQLITDENPRLTGKLGYFPIPGKRAGKPGSVFTGGSVLIIPEKSDRQDEAYGFLKLLTGEKWQRRIAETMSFVPNKTTLADALQGDAGAEAMAEAAANGRATPSSPRWGELEADNPVKEYQTAVLTGADPREASRKASDEITRVLNATGG